MIEPLTKEDLEETLELTNSVFTYEAGLKWPQIAYRASLGYKKEQQRIKGIDMCRYWVEKDKQILGTIGLYHQKEDSPHKGWLGWFCVSPKARRNGIGRKLLNFAIEESQRLGYKELWLYTSRSPEEIAAQFLYEKMSFEIQAEKKEKPYTVLYRRKLLTDTSA